MLSMLPDSPGPAGKEEPPKASAGVVGAAGWKLGIRFSVELPAFSGAFPGMQAQS